MAHILTGQLSDRRSAEAALAALRADGFEPRRASLVSKEQVESAPPPRKKAARSVSGSLIGIVIGAVVGAIIAWLTSSLVHSVATTTTAGVLACAIVGGAIGWFVGGLAGSGQPIEEAEYRQERVELGRMQLSLDPGDREMEARDILQRFGARDVRLLEDSNGRWGNKQRSGGGSNESQHALT